MAIVDEEILLHVPEDTGFDNLTALDEDLLLGAGDVSRKPTQESVDDVASLLDTSGPIPEQNDDDTKNEEEEEVESEKEELDYDEEEDDNDEKRERTSRYTSEKKGGARVDSAEGDENKAGKGKRTGIPSLFDKTITNNPMISGDKPIGVILRIEGEQERVFYPPPNFMNDVPPQNIVPRLPNGIPLIGMPANHGRAGFGSSYKDQQRMAGGAGTVPGGHWDEAVNMFLNETKRKSRSHKRSYSRSSFSSYSSDSSSRSSSRERRRRKEPRRDHRRDDRKRSDDRRDRRRHDDRRPRHDSHRDREDRERDYRRRKEQSKNSAIESAKALGLSSEYMDRVNEQKRKREEVVRKKEERRHGVEKKEVSQPVPATSEANQKMKAFLVVNVTGVQQLPTAVKRIETMAIELGPIKKCWRSSDDTVSIIFNAHDKAKQFMVNFNGKVLSGLRITVSLEKKFLNLNEVNV